MYTAAPERTHAPVWRVVVAFIFAPGVAALLMAVVVPLYAGLSDPLERLWRSAVAFAVLGAYPAALVVGIPTYVVLRRHFAPRLISCSLVGAIVAALPWFVLSLISTPDQASIGGRATVLDGSRTAYGWLTEASFLGQIALFGATGGALFWLIAAAGSRAGKVR